jgi:hypothetical protein
MSPMSHSCCAGVYYGTRQPETPDNDRSAPCPSSL